MSRALIAGAVAAAIAVVTVTAYAVTSARIASASERELSRRVAKAQELLVQNASLEGLQLLNRAEAVAAEDVYARALGEDSRSEAAAVATTAFDRFHDRLSEDEPAPDVLALTDADGRVISLSGVARPLSDMWLDDGEVRYAPLRAALEEGVITSEFVEMEMVGLARAGMAPVREVRGGEILGAVVLAYAVSSEDANERRDLLGADVVYAAGDRVRAASFHDDGRAVPGREELEAAIAAEGLVEAARNEGFSEVARVELGGESYVATAGRLPRFSSGALPDDYPGHAAAAVVLDSMEATSSAPGRLSWSILLVGVGGILAAMVGIVATARSLRAPIEEIETGVNEIINGDIDRTFRPIGSELDGLASSLNVMLARILGRPEPDEERFDEEGNLLGPARAGAGMKVEEDAPSARDAAPSAKDAEAVALAEEPEPEYYNRLFHEYIEARRDVGESVEEITYESFVAKLRLSEASLRKRYGARSVRFKVVVQGGKVILKPVPLV